jgi:CBS domain-containing protein/CheY-like chemotaxis protein
MSKIRLLIVDEHSAVRQALGARLGSSPHIEVLAVASDLEEGLLQAFSLNPDVILLEPKTIEGYHHPLLGGRLSEMKGGVKNGRRPALIVLTSYTDEEERAEAMRAGACRYLLKDIDSERLIAEIEMAAAEANMKAQTYLTQGEKLMKRQLVKDWMTHAVITISPETSLPEAHRLMTEKKVRRLPVVDDGRLVGIVTRGDIRGAEPSGATTLSIWEVNYLLSRLKVQEIMTSRPCTIHMDATVGAAARLMREHKISGLPVFDSEDNLAGIITESDIFRMVVEVWLQEEESPVVA